MRVVVFLILLSFSIASTLSVTVEATSSRLLLRDYGNITIKWDIVQQSGSTYDAKVTIYNYQLHRHIEHPPGWHLSWEWRNKEVINSMQGAEAKEQGICNASAYGGVLPHCCLRNPRIIDMSVGTPFNKQTANCCKNGVLTTFLQDPSKSVASFQMNIGGLVDFKDYKKPFKFSFSNPGYSCGDLVDVAPTKTPVDGGRRWTQALETWQLSCTYSQFRASPAPTCCVSLSTFYSPDITSCQNCSCACRTQPGSKCVKFGEDPPPVELSLDPDVEPPSLVRCTNHMCPVQVHWHVKQSYKEYWRVKLTITNMNTRKNYTRWNIAVEHPNMRSIVQVFSFNYKPIFTDPHINETMLFWGIDHYNDLLMHAGENGNVQTEMLLHKDPGFTFDTGYALPRSIFFNGQDCVMPAPVDYPRLPKEKPQVDKRFWII